MRNTGSQPASVHQVGGLGAPDVGVGSARSAARCGQGIPWGWALADMMLANGGAQPGAELNLLIDAHTLAGHEHSGSVSEMAGMRRDVVRV